MKIKKLSTFILVPLFVAAFAFSPAYSSDPAGKPSLMEKVRKAEKAMDRINPPKKGGTPLSDKQIVTVEQCSKNYEACSEKCTTVEKEEEYITCDVKCKEELSLCEKELPKDWKTIK
jgi:hypothetical protein